MDGNRANARCVGGALKSQRVDDVGTVDSVRAATPERAGQSRELMLHRNRSLWLVRLISTKVPHPVCAHFIILTASWRIWARHWPKS